MNKNNIIKSFLAGFFSFITIGFLTLLTYKTDFGIPPLGSSYSMHNIFIYSPT